MAFISVSGRVNIVYAVGLAYTAVTATIAFIASSTASKLINDGCREWIKPVNSTNTVAIGQFLKQATKEEICKWGPFVADLVIVTGTFQIFGMGLYGKDYRVNDLTKVKYGTGGLSNCLMKFAKGEDVKGSPALTNEIVGFAKSSDEIVFPSSAFEEEKVDRFMVSINGASSSEEEGLKRMRGGHHEQVDTQPPSLAISNGAEADSDERFIGVPIDASNSVADLAEVRIDFHHHTNTNQDTFNLAGDNGAGDDSN